MMSDYEQIFRNEKALRVGYRRTSTICPACHGRGTVKPKGGKRKPCYKCRASGDGSDPKSYSTK